MSHVHMSALMEICYQAQIDPAEVVGITVTPTEVTFMVYDRGEDGQPQIEIVDETSMVKLRQVTAQVVNDMQPHTHGPDDAHTHTSDSDASDDIIVAPA